MVFSAEIGAVRSCWLVLLEPVRAALARVKENALDPANGDCGADDLLMAEWWLTRLSVRAPKTQTRRPWQGHWQDRPPFGDGPEFVVCGRPQIWTIHTPMEIAGKYGERQKWAVGKDYAVQARGRQQHSGSLGRVTITSIRREAVLDITEDDARAEGFIPRTLPSGAVSSERREFLWCWQDMYKSAFKGVDCAVLGLGEPIVADGPAVLAEMRRDWQARKEQGR